MDTILARRKQKAVISARQDANVLGCTSTLDQNFVTSGDALARGEPKPHPIEWRERVVAFVEGSRQERLSSMLIACRGGPQSRIWRDDV